MRQSQRDKRTYLIIGLCAVLVVMAVGFAAFSQQLQINSTSNITSNWNVQITGITRFASSGAGVSDVSGSPSYDNTNGLTATFNTNLTSPGDYAIYKIKIENLGSLNAKLSNITLNAGTSNDITYYVNKNQNNGDITDTDRLIDEDDVLNPTGDSSNLDEGYVYVTVKYNNREGQTSPTGDNKTVTATVKLDFVQSNNEATSVEPSSATFTGTIYRRNDIGAAIGDSIATVTGTKWCYFEIDSGAQYDCFDKETDCNNFLSDNNWTETYTCQPKTIDYTTTESEIQSEYSYYLKHTVVNDIITESFACMKFSFINTPVCLQGGNASYYTANRGIIGGLADTFAAQNPAGSCYIDYEDKTGDTLSSCHVGDLNVVASSDGSVGAYDTSANGSCDVNDYGYAFCY